MLFEQRSKRNVSNIGLSLTATLLAPAVTLIDAIQSAPEPADKFLWITPDSRQSVFHE